MIKSLISILPQYALLYLVVDGAAFGGYIEPVLSLGMLKPESFEYLLLKTSAFQKYLSDELENTWKYCDSIQYVTWERYYTDLLCEMCKKYYAFSYTKRKLNAFFINQPFFEQVRAQLTDVVEKVDKTD